ADWGLPKLRIRPENQRDFFASELPFRVTFQTGSDGKVHDLTIYPPRGQKGVPANKLAAEKYRRPRCESVRPSRVAAGIAQLNARSPSRSVLFRCKADVV